MQTSSGINKYYISMIGYCTINCIKSDTGRITAHFLLNDGNSNPLAPDDKLFYSCCAKCIGCTQINIQSLLFKLPGKFTDGGGFAYTVDTDNQYDIRPSVGRNIISLGITGIVVGKQLCDFIAQNVVQLTCAYVFITCHTSFYTLNDVQRCVNTHVTCYKNLLKMIKHIVIYFRLASYSTRQLTEETFLSLLKTMIKRFLLFF